MTRCLVLPYIVIIILTTQHSLPHFDRGDRRLEEKAWLLIPSPHIFRRPWSIAYGGDSTAYRERQRRGSPNKRGKQACEG